MGPTGTSPSSAAGDLRPAPARPDSRPRDPAAIPGSRAGRSWVALIPAVVIFIVVLVFVLQNMQSGTVSFLFLSGRFPVGVALLAATVLGGLAVFLLGSVRILQLRRLARRTPRR